MKKFILVAFCAIIIHSLSAQILYTESFETDGNGTRYVADADIICNTTDYFGRADDSSINGGTDYSGEIGTFYWAGESHDDVINGNPGSCSANNGQTSKNVVFGPIDITGHAAIEVATLYGARQGTNWEGTEGMSMSYSFDNSNFVPGIFFAPASMPDQEIREGGVESGTALDLAMANFTFSFATGGATQLWLRFTATNEGSSEELAIDQVVVSVTLPVELVSFSAKPMDQGVMLDWATASEENNHFFAVERSVDGQRFEEIGKVNGAGSSYTPIDYQFLDNNLPSLAPTLYYRLRQVDYGGEYEYSEVQVVSNTVLSDQLRLAPNPVNNELNVNLGSNLDGQTVQAEIYDLNGRLLKLMVVDPMDERFTISTSELNEGIYLLKVSNNRSSQTQRFVKQ